MIGQQIGSYAVLSRLGEGGMGEVYRARDTTLDRDVALKLLPALFATDPERRARFEREAKLLAALNHPNIAQVYGAGVAGHAYIAMELVDGDDLSVLIQRGPVPLTQALAIARQIASALESAHDQGIVHRDLKPANVKVRDDGTVKVLDFGLAKALTLETDPAGSSVSNSPTLTARSTQLGMILGTAAYMAPEQAKGRGVDRRADVWAFGGVLFEMLAGRRAFEGDDVSEVLASVLKTDPDWSALPANTPASVRRLLQRCLEKDPKKRLRDLSEGLLQMDDSLAATSSGPAAVQDTRGRAWWSHPLLVAAVTAGVVAAAVYAGMKSTTPIASAAAPVRFAFESSPNLNLTPARRDVVLSPDGRSAVISVLVPQGPPMLYVRRLDQLDMTPLRGSETSIAPFFSPDGKWIGFLDSMDQASLRKVPVEGGLPLPLGKVPTTAYGAAWLPDGHIVLGVVDHGLMRISETGGTPEPIVAQDDKERVQQLWPSLVPGTTVVLFTTNDASRAPLSSAEVSAIDLTTKRIVKSGIAGTHPQYVNTGHVLFAQVDGLVRAVRFDPATMAFSGTPVPVIDEVGAKLSGAANYFVSPDGTLVYTRGAGAVMRTLVWADRTGRETAIKAPARSYFYARVSPDGKRLSLDVRDQEEDIWIWDLTRETMTRLTDKEGPDQYGLWTPNGERIVFSSLGTGRNEIFWHRPDGVGQPEQLTDTTAEKLTPFPNAITSDGKVIFRAVGKKNDLFVVDASGDRKTRALLATEHNELNASLSPDGKYMAFESDMSGKVEVYVRPFPDVNSRQWPVSTGGGSEPVWSTTGRELFYVSTDLKMMAVPVTISPAFELGRPVALFDASAYYFGGIGRNYDVAKDGRFVLVKDPARSQGAMRINIIVNWVEELKARLGIK